MEPEATGWWHKHGPTLLILAAAFSLTFFIRTLWNVPLFQQYGTSYFFAGGSDSFYHWRVSDYIILNHKNLIFDPLLKYPTGAINPREPLFDWMNAIFGILFAPAFGGSAASAGMYSLELAAPLWAALSVFPLYLVGKEVSSRRTGLLAVLIWPFLVANIDSSTFGYANYLSFYTFFILVMVYAQLRTIRASGTRKWVASYTSPRSVLKGIKDYLYYETAAVRWAVFTGVAFGVVILTWQGYTFLVALVVIFLVVQMIIERIRRQDSFGLYFTTWIVGLVGFPLAFPYYYVQGDYHIWFLEPIVIYFGALLVLLPFLFLRDHPWVLSLPVLIGTSAVAVGALALASPAAFSDILSGQGYFVKTLIYSTVAEAQAPSVDSLIISYGVVTFFLAFAGLAFVGYHLIRGRFERRHMLFFIFGIISIYLPLSAAKFFYIGSAAYSLLPAEGVSRILDIGGFPTFRRNVVSLSDRRSQLSAFRRSFKVRHVLVVLLVLAIVVPNIWYAMDAGIPFNTKSQYDLQVFDSLPPPLRVSAANASSFYLGAAGGEIDTPNQYDEAGYDWLATQDTNLPEPQRPALISWWDYGFQTIAEGDHPAVADNFQNGIDPSGNFLLSQNESLAIGVLATTLLTSEAQETGMPYLPPGLNAVLAADGVNLPELHTLLANTSADIPLVEAYPSRYLPVDPSDLDSTNAMYDAVSYFLASTLSETAVAKVYDDVQAYTGWSIRYAMVDTRLIPFSGQSTGIYYAPADLTDRVIDAGGNPSAYFSVSIVGSDGNTYLEGTEPAGVTPVSYNINYTPAFYNSMIYHIFFGYDEQEVGQGTGVPWLSSGSAAGDPLEPGWMLQHFQVVYRTGYACNTPNATSGSPCFYATNVPTADEIQSKDNGTADTSPDTMFNDGGEAILEYYPGQPMSGTVTLGNGRPIADARVTVDDSWGIPHMTTLTASDGSYSLILPPGRDTVNVTTGALNPISQQGATLLGEFNITVPDAYGLSYDAPTLVEPLVIKGATVQGLLTWNAANSKTGPTPIVGASVVLYGTGLSTITATTDASGSFKVANVPPATYNVSLLIRGANISESNIGPTPGSTFNESLSVSAGTVLGHVADIHGRSVAGALVTLSNPTGTVAVGTSNATGAFAISDLAPGNYTVVATLASAREGSQTEPADITTSGGNATLNLTIGPIVSVSVEVLRNGLPVAHLPVRFTEIVPPVSYTVPQNNTTVTPADQAQGNTTVALTDVDGLAQATVAEGNYSIYALGLNGSEVEAGFWSGSLSTGSAAVPPIELAPASKLYGLANTTGNSTVSSVLEVAAYTAAGDTVWAFTNTSDAYALWLPDGTYTIEVSSVNPAEAAIGKVTVSGPTHFDLPALAATPITSVVRDNATGQPIEGAAVHYTYGPSGGTVVAFTNPEGNASAILPTQPSNSGGPPPDYCVNVTAPGYVANDQCGIPAGALLGLGPVELAGAPATTTVTYTGVAAGVPVLVNFTAVSGGARSASVSGLSPLSLALTPGTYEVSAFAPGTGSGHYLPTESDLTVTLRPGTSAPTIVVPMAYQVPAKGNVTVPSGSTLAGIAISLDSRVMNLTVRGNAFESGFYVAPGSYDYLATTTLVPTLPGRAGFGTLTVSSSGTISTALTLPTPAVTFHGAVTTPGGAPLTASGAITFVNPAGFPFRVVTTSGAYNATLPVNVTYRPFLNLTATFVEANASVTEALSVPIGQICDVLPLGTDCDLALSGNVVDLAVSGKLLLTGSPALLPGSLLIEGPLPATSSIAVTTAADGSFTAALPPGTYTVYANSSSGTYATLTTISVALGAANVFDLPLTAAWDAALTVLPPSDGASIGSVAVTITAYTGLSVTLSGVGVRTPLELPLPLGTYSVSASAASSPYGVATNATATATLPLLTGNSALALHLAEVLVRSVELTFLGPSSGSSSIIVPTTGATVRMGFTVRNTGNLPVNITVDVGTSIWNWTVTPRNFTLGTSSSDDAASGAISVVVPAGRSVTPPPLFLQADLAGTSTQIGQSALPAPIIVTPTPGVAIGASDAVKPDVTPTRITFDVYAANTGNIAESATLAAVDGARLQQLGWNVSFVSSGSALTGPLSLSTGANQSINVVLNASHGSALPPGSVTISATITNRSLGMTSSTVTLTIPVLALPLNSSSITVAGPNVGSPPTTPDWLVPALVFVPALAVIVLMVVLRWRATRRWVR